MQACCSLVSVILLRNTHLRFKCSASEGEAVGESEEWDPLEGACVEVVRDWIECAVKGGHGSCLARYRGYEALRHTTTQS